MFRIVKVVGDSMEPELSNGDYVITRKPRSIRPGFMYVVNHSDLGRIVKWLTKIDDKSYYFAGGNGESIGTDVMGPVTKDRILGKVILRIRKNKAPKNNSK